MEVLDNQESIMDLEQTSLFDNPPSRRNTGSLKWDVSERELPMWVADMDFQTAPAIRRALAERVEHGIFGYSIIPTEWATSYKDWWSRRHGWEMNEENLIFCTGVIPAISSIVRKLTTPNENVVIQKPVYDIFVNSIVNNGARVLSSELVFDGDNYDMDLVDLEKKLSDPQTTLMILCNPHNPVGKIWPRETLAKVGELCEKYHVTLISDEIHCDLCEPGYALVGESREGYIPFASVSEACRRCSIICLAPTKAFNLAGLQTAAVYVENPVLRHKVWRGLNTDEVAEPNAFACDAAIAAFTEGEEWLQACNAYTFENRRILEEFCEKELDHVSVVKGRATYLAWVNIGAYGRSEEVADALREKTGLFVTAGGHYGPTGDDFLRINLACSRSTLLDGLKRLKAGLRELSAGR